MPIKGLTDVLRMPRLGKIRLGVKEKGEDGYERPKATDYFVVPPEVAAVYGERPQTLDIAFPVDNLEQVFEVWYKRYGQQAGLICRGDGETAWLALDYAKSAFGLQEYGIEVRRDGEFYKDGVRLQVSFGGAFGGKAWLQVPCKGLKCPLFQAEKCSVTGQLSVLLPRVPGLLGIYTLTTSGIDSILNIIGAATLFQRMSGGHLAFVDMRLRLRMEEKHPLIDGKRLKTRVPVLYVDMEKSFDEVRKRLLEIAGKGQSGPQAFMFYDINDGDGDEDEKAALPPATSTASTSLVTEVAAKKSKSESESEEAQIEVRVEAGVEARKEPESGPDSEEGSEKETVKVDEEKKPEQKKTQEPDISSLLSGLGKEVKPYAVMTVVEGLKRSQGAKSGQTIVHFRAKCLETNIGSIFNVFAGESGPNLKEGRVYRCVLSPAHPEPGFEVVPGDTVEVTVDLDWFGKIPRDKVPQDVLVFASLQKVDQEKSQQAA
ncbi:MAG: hypothetical protein ACPLRM_04460 [Anaerolineae bacterium]